MLGGVVCGAAAHVWWLLFSRARWAERLGAIVLMAIGVMLTWLAVDPSIAGGAQGYLAYIFGFIFFAFALAVWAAATEAVQRSHSRPGARAGAARGRLPADARDSYRRR